MPEFELAPDAEQDLVEIATYTVATWGAARSVRYEAELTACLRGLAAGNLRVRRPIALRPDILVRRCGHHFVFALRRDRAPLLVLAVLHESMDLMQRLRSRLLP